jgi:hypothetical protein
MGHDVHGQGCGRVIDALFCSLWAREGAGGVESGRGVGQVVLRAAEHQEQERFTLYQFTV